MGAAVRDTTADRRSVVAEFQKLFLATGRRRKASRWRRSTSIRRCSPRAKKSYARSAARRRAFQPDLRDAALAISSASTEVWLPTPISCPTRNCWPRSRRRRAAWDVRLVLPGRTDSALVFHAGRSCYDQLLHGGVEDLRARNAMMHAKTAVIDGVWSTVARRTSTGAASCTTRRSMPSCLARSSATGCAQPSRATLRSPSRSRSSNGSAARSHARQGGLRSIVAVLAVAHGSCSSKERCGHVARN